MLSMNLSQETDLPYYPAAELSELMLEGKNKSRGRRRVAAEDLREELIDALRTVCDPEVPVNVYDLGLIYRLEVDGSGNVELDMTLTAPGCPMADQVFHEVHTTLLAVPGVARVRTRLVWDPPWTPDVLSEAMRLELGLD
jgi:FeS assembly SUF system protein